MCVCPREMSPVRGRDRSHCGGLRQRLASSEVVNPPVNPPPVWGGRRAGEPRAGAVGRDGSAGKPGERPPRARGTARSTARVQQRAAATAEQSYVSSVPFPWKTRAFYRVLFHRGSGSLGKKKKFSSLLCVDFQLAATCSLGGCFTDFFAPS